MFPKQDLEPDSILHPEYRGMWYFSSPCLPAREDVGHVVTDTTSRRLFDAPGVRVRHGMYGVARFCFTTPEEALAALTGRRLAFRGLIKVSGEFLSCV
jgi:hypothetical protein